MASMWTRIRNCIAFLFAPIGADVFGDERSNILCDEHDNIIGFSEER
jgi:hypothetical protein